MMPEGQQLYEIVKGLCSEVKEVRAGAEQCYEREWLTRPQVLFPLMIELLCQVEEPIVHLDDIISM